MEYVVITFWFCVRNINVFICKIHYHYKWLSLTLIVNPIYKIPKMNSLFFHLHMMDFNFPYCFLLQNHKWNTWWFQVGFVVMVTLSQINRNNSINNIIRVNTSSYTVWNIVELANWMNWYGLKGQIISRRFHRCPVTLKGYLPKTVNAHQQPHPRRPKNTGRLTLYSLKSAFFRATKFRIYSKFHQYNFNLLNYAPVRKFVNENSKIYASRRKVV